MPDKHYVGEVGTEVTLDTGVLIGSASAQHIKYRKPDGVTTGTWSASLYNSYSLLANATGTYFLQYSLASGDLDTPGKWYLQAYVASVAGTWLGETIELQVFDTYE